MRMSGEFSLGWRRAEAEWREKDEISPCKFPLKCVSRRCSGSDEDAIWNCSATTNIRIMFFNLFILFVFIVCLFYE